MKIKVLIENTTSSELKCEHGLSIYIEYGKKKILLDAGTSGDFIDNAKKMDVKLEELDCAVLSHGHYDHAGGFDRFFDEYAGINLYAMRSVQDKYYSGSGGSIHDIGIPRKILDKYLDRFIFIDQIEKLSEGIYIVPHSKRGLELIGKRAKLYKEVEGRLIDDDFEHELSLVVENGNRLVVFNSCTHAGIINVLEEVSNAFSNKKVDCFIGGLHMKGKVDDKVICTFSETEIMQITEELDKFGLKKLYTGHCTGEPAYELIKKYIGDKVENLHTGKTFSLEIED